MKVGIATDHNGVNEKQLLIKYISDLGYEVKDYSQNNYDLDDYPDFAFSLAESVVNKEVDLGILMCGTGIGMSIAANKVKGIRCAHVSNVNEATLCKGHNNANIIALSYKNSIEELKLMVKTYLETDFYNEDRHIRRINKITEYENEH